MSADLDTTIRGGSILESLDRRTLRSQISAAKDLIRTSRKKFDRHPVRYKERESEKAYFNLTGHDAILEIELTSDKRLSHRNLFLKIILTKQNSKGVIGESLGLVTVDSPDKVDGGEALFLSGWTPQQLRFISGLIRSASPMGKSEYEIVSNHVSREVERLNWARPFRGQA